MAFESVEEVGIEAYRLYRQRVVQVNFKKCRYMIGNMIHEAPYVNKTSQVLDSIW